MPPLKHKTKKNFQQKKPCPSRSLMMHRFKEPRAKGFRLKKTKYFWTKMISVLAIVLFFGVVSSSWGLNLLNSVNNLKDFGKSNVSINLNGDSFGGFVITNSSSTNSSSASSPVVNSSSTNSSNWSSGSNGNGNSSVPSGKFEMPEKSQYDEGITRKTSFREWIIEVTNFALSFVGILAIIVLIVGGFMYILSGGEEEQAKKGGKTIRYALIGILIILTSYALINTVLHFAKDGSEPDSVGGSISTSTNGSIVANGEYITATSQDGKSFASLHITSLESASSTGVTLSTTLSSGTAYWNCGDGVLQKVDSVTCKYATGTYKAELSYVTGSGTTTDTKKIYVDPITPNLQISGNYIINNDLTFNASNSTTKLGSITGYSWSFGDGSGSTLASATHAYKSPGNYTVTLKLTDGYGFSKSKTKEVKILNKGSASFTAKADSSEASTINFDGSASKNPTGGITGLTHSWDFGDGSTGCGQTATHSYSAKSSYDVTLTIGYKSDDGTTLTSSVTKTVDVKSVLGVSLKVTSTLTLGDTGSFKITASNSTGSSILYNIDYGDGHSGTESTSATSKSFSHKYAEAGKYTATAQIEDDGDTASTTKTVYVNKKDSPTAFIDVSGATQTDSAGTKYSATTTTSISFNAANSTNTEGQTSGLAYSWNFGDGEYDDSASTTHTFSSSGDHTVKLTVTDTVTNATADTSVTITISKSKPTLSNLVVTPSGLVNSEGSYDSPLTVSVKTEGANDADGSIIQYKWLISRDSGSKWSTTAITTSSSSSFKIVNKSGSGETILFKVILKDNDNQTYDSYSDGGLTSISLDLGSQDNTAPKANFSVDYTSVNAGQTITFTSSSSDADGDELTYGWDFGDGSTSSGSSATVNHTYNKAGKFTASLSVSDGYLTSQKTLTITVNASSTSTPPTAAFTYTVSGLTISLDAGNSAASTGSSLTSYEWDFDTSQDSNVSGSAQNGDSLADNDVETTGQTATNTYTASGNYQIKLTVTDANGKTASVKRIIKVKEENVNTNGG